MTFDCGGKTHTQLTFALLQPVFNGTVKLELLVDGLPRDELRANNGFDWRGFVFDVPRGMHKYTFRASATADVPVPFVLDTLVCNNHSEDLSPNQRVDLDDDFVPPETGGDWFIDNVHGVHNDGTGEPGSAALHPPALLAGDSKEMTFDCGGAVHSQITFALLQPVFNGTVKLELLVDGLPRDELKANNGFDWRGFVFDVPQGLHKYTFRASATADVPVPFVLDTFACNNHNEELSPNQRVDFDDNFVPPETGGDWFIDNVHGVHNDGTGEPGSAALHPPALLAGDSKEMTFDCGGAVHSQITFALLQPVFNGTVKLELLVDGLPRDELKANNGFDWRGFVFDVPQGLHKYTFRASATADVPVPFVLDTFACLP